MAVLPPDPVYTFRNTADTAAVNCICFHRAERLISGTATGFVHLFDLQTKRVVHRFSIPGSGPVAAPITTVQKHDETLHAQQRGGLVTTWSLSNAGYSLEHSMDTGHTGFCRIEVVPERGWLLAPLRDDAIGVYDLRRPGELVSTLRPPRAEDGRIATSPGVVVTGDGDDPLAADTSTSTVGGGGDCGNLMCFKYLLIGGRDYVLGCYQSGDFVTWDVVTGGGSIIDSRRLDECPMAVDFDAHSNRGIFGGPSDRLGVFAYSRNTMQLQQRSEITLKTAGVNCVRIRGDRRVFSVGGWDGRIRIYSWNSLRPLAVLTEHRSAVMDIAYTADKVSLWDAPVMAAAGQDGHVSLWDLYN